MHKVRIGRAAAVHAEVRDVPCHGEKEVSSVEGQEKKSTTTPQLLDWIPSRARGSGYARPVPASSVAVGAWLWHQPQPPASPTAQISARRVWQRPQKMLHSTDELEIAAMWQRITSRRALCFRGWWPVLAAGCFLAFSRRYGRPFFSRRVKAVFSKPRGAAEAWLTIGGRSETVRLANKPSAPECHHERGHLAVHVTWVLTERYADKQITARPPTIHGVQVQYAQINRRTSISHSRWQGPR